MAAKLERPNLFDLSPPRLATPFQHLSISITRQPLNWDSLIISYALIIYDPIGQHAIM